MATPKASMILGTTKSWTVTAKRNNVALTNVFTDADAVSAKVFAGDDRAALLTPTATWISSAAGTIQVAITAAQLAAAGVTPGEYTLQVFVTPASDGQTRAVFSGPISFLPTAGTGTAPTTYATYQQLLAHAPELEKLQDARDDQAQFAEQRHLGRTETDSRILNAYRPQPGRTRRYYNATKTAAGPYGPSYLTAADLANATYLPPTPAQVKAWLDADGLVLEAGLVEFNARWAAALVYGAQPGASNPYQQLAVQEKALAEAAWARAVVEIDTDADDVAEVRIDRDVTWLA